MDGWTTFIRVNTWRDTHVRVYCALYHLQSSPQHSCQLNMDNRLSQTSVISLWQVSSQNLSHFSYKCRYRRYVQWMIMKGVKLWPRRLQVQSVTSQSVWEVSLKVSVQTARSCLARFSVYTVFYVRRYDVTYTRCYPHSDPRQRKDQTSHITALFDLYYFPLSN